VTTSEGFGANAGPRTAGDREFIILVVALMACGALAIDTILPAFADVRAEFGMPADSTRVRPRIASVGGGRCRQGWCCMC
jgi:hypothetical protein